MRSSTTVTVGGLMVNAAGVGGVMRFNSTEGGGKRSAEDIAAWGPELPQQFKEHDHQENRYTDPAVLDIGGQVLVGFGTGGATSPPQTVPDSNGGGGEAASVSAANSSGTDTIGDAVSVCGGDAGAAAEGGGLLEGVGDVCEAVVGIFGS